MNRVTTILSGSLFLVGSATADPLPTTPPPPVQAPDPDPAPVLSGLVPLQFAPINRPPPSLRLEAARVMAERFAGDWRFPEPGPLLGVDGGTWFTGAGYYQPRSRRAAALHGGSIAATLLGEILLAADSPLAGVGALVTGATLDAAAADADRAAESKR
jgi:hypothetical protein